MPNSLHDLMLLRYCVVKGSYTCARHQAMWESPSTNHTFVQSAPD
jgi:hypothetical protein